MTTTDAQAIQAGTVLIYNDGRPGHTQARAEVLKVSPVAMVVQFDDRADTTTISFADDGWLNHLAIDLETSIARAFCVLLKSELSPEDFSAMRAAHSSGKYPSECCPSHDYCDANMVMDAAFEKMTGTPASDDLQNDKTIALWNNAWNIARAHNYEFPPCA